MSRIEPDRADPPLPALWICPRCGARLVSRNLWHSCGQHTVEELFAKADPSALEWARDYVAMLRSLGDVQVLPQKTRLVGVARVRFAGLTRAETGSWPPSPCVDGWTAHASFVKRADYGPMWRGHFVLVTAPEDLDDELRAWLVESHDTVGVQRGLGDTPT